MAIGKRKKNTRQRGHRTHGWGAAKKHRGAGSRGGRGMAGSGKRADQKKQSIIKEFGNKYFGKKGFVSRNVKKIKKVNLDFLEKNIGKFEKKNDGYYVDLGKMGYSKLLGSGKVVSKFVIKVGSASKKAVEKIKEKKGEVLVGEVKKTSEVVEEKGSEKSVKEQS